MVSFLKTHWLRILIAAILIVLIWIYIPYKEQFYLDEDREHLESLSKEVLICIEVLLLISLSIYWLIKRIRVNQLAISLLNGLLLGLGFFFLFSPFFLSAFYLINDISFSKNLSKEYRVVDVGDTDKSLFLYNTESKQSFHATTALEKDIKAIPAKNQGVELMFKKGLLGCNKIQSLVIK